MSSDDHRGSIGSDDDIERTIDDTRRALLGPEQARDVSKGAGPDWGGLVWTAPWDTSGQIVALGGGVERARAVHSPRTPPNPVYSFPAEGDPRAALPAVNDLVVPARVRRYGHRRVTYETQQALNSGRLSIERGQWIDRNAVEEDLDARLSRELSPVINATGDLTPLDLGRAPWGASALAAVERAAGYCAVEIAVGTSGDARPSAGVEARLCALTGAEAALVVNNRAAAVMLMLAATVRDGREVLVSRGELVDVRGEYRVPAVIQASGARLCEVGTTNRTQMRDYTDALAADQLGREGRRTIGAILRVHDDGFQQVGFVSRPELSDLVGHGVPLLVDQGSGVPRGDVEGANPSVAAAVAAGASVVCFSGDELLAGPQAGLIVGRSRFVEAMRNHPLYQVLRVGKVTLAALEGTLDDHLRDQPTQIDLMRRMTVDELRVAVEYWSAVLSERVSCRVVDVPAGLSAADGSRRLQPSVALAIRVPDPSKFVAGLARGRPPVVARVVDGWVQFDGRTVVPLKQGKRMLQIIEGALNRTLGL